MSSEPFRIERFDTHHVLLQPTHFTIEHPIYCELDRCDIYDRFKERWDEPPAATGQWYEIVDRMDVRTPNRRHTYLVEEVEDT